MDSFIKKIFEGKNDEFVHRQFQKFSRGEFKGKASVNAKKSSGGFSISTTYEYANELVRSMAEKLGDKTANVKGVIVSTRNLKEMPEFQKTLAHANVKQFMGVKQFQIEETMTGRQIINILNLLPTSFIAFSFSADDSELKIKQKSPKSAKPSTKSEESPVCDFCKLKTNDLFLVKTIIFDVDDFKSVEISHNFIINALEIPKNEKDPIKMRENTIRKGKIIRRLKVNGIEKIREIAFEA
ncbi:MAG: hypothetical protein WC533_00145 [Candidatus Pacearchaeota archaeon]